MGAPARVVGHHAGGDDRPQRRRVRRRVPVGRGVAGGRPGARRAARPPLRDAAARRHAQRAAGRGRAARAAPRWGSASPRSTRPSCAWHRGPRRSSTSSRRRSPPATSTAPASTSTSPPTRRCSSRSSTSSAPFCRTITFRRADHPVRLEPHRHLDHRRRCHRSRLLGAPPAQRGALPRRHRHDPRRHQPRARRDRTRADAHLAGPHGAGPAGGRVAHDAAPEGGGRPTSRFALARRRAGVGGRCRDRPGGAVRRRGSAIASRCPPTRSSTSATGSSPTSPVRRGRRPKGVLRKRPAPRRVVLGPVVAPLGRRRRSPTGRARPRCVIIDDGHPLAAALAAPARRLAVASCRSGSVSASSVGRTAASRSTRLAPTTGPRSSTRWRPRTRCPRTIVHVTAVGRSRGRRRLGARPATTTWSPTARPSSATTPACCSSPVRCPRRSEPVRLALSRAASTPSIRPIRCSRSGRCCTARCGSSRASSATSPRWPSTSTRPRTAHRPAANLVDAIVRELDAEWPTDLVVLRRGERWIRDLEPVPLPPTLATPVAAGRRAPDHRWLRRHRHVARRAHRQELRLADPRARRAHRAAPRSRSGPLRSRRRRPTPCCAGASSPSCSCEPTAPRVVVAAADVTDEAAMAAVVARTRKQHGRITSVIHSAGILRDALIALRTPVASSAVVDVKALGALVLWRVLADDPPDLFVLFSSVSSIIGLPGQVDYTAANAFLDAYAAKANRDERTRAITVNWNAWQEVGMAVAAARVERDLAPVVGPHGPGTTTELFDGDRRRRRRSSSSPRGFSRKRHWLLAEHVVRGGESLIPGTGFLEMARAAAAPRATTRAGRAARRVLPLAVRRRRWRGADAQAQARPDRPAPSTMFSDTETAPHVTATVVPVDPEPAPMHDLAAVRARCTQQVEHFDGYSDQPFMDFGPRWGKPPDRSSTATARPLVTTVMPPEFESELRRPVAAPGAARRRHRERPGADPGLRARRDVLRSVLLRTGAVAAPASGHRGEPCPPALGDGRRPRRVRHRDLRRARRGGGRRSSRSRCAASAGRSR